MGGGGLWMEGIIQRAKGIRMGGGGFGRWEKSKGRRVLGWAEGEWMPLGLRYQLV